jgi:CPA2 family monovalent cation:H+ antiporter-2
MPHDTPLITTIVAGLGLAFVFGAAAHKLRLPPLVGYLLAGVIVGPAAPGLMPDQGLVQQLAEVGIILLMFGVGLHFSFRDLMAVRMVAVPGALIEITLLTAIGAGLGVAIGWPVPAAVVFGLCLSVASTVVLLRALQERRLLDSERGHIAVGWLIVEDLVMVIVLVVLPIVAGVLAPDSAAPPPSGKAILAAIGLTLAKIGAFLALMLVIGRRVIPYVLDAMADSGSRELFRLAVLALALGVAFGAAELFNVSLALGAFFAGLIMNESRLSQEAAEESLPMRDAFAVLFFVSVGMLFDPHILIESPLQVLGTVAIILIGKSLIAYALVRLLGHPMETALTIGASLANIGEFSFILAALGVSLKILPEDARNLVLAGSLMSMLLNPVMFGLQSWLRLKLIRGASGRRHADISPERGRLRPATGLNGHVVMVGFGRVGTRVAEALKHAGVPFLVIEDGINAVARLRREGVEAILGNAARADILAVANIRHASHLVLAIPSAYEAAQIATEARAANPDLRIIARAHSDAGVAHLKARGIEHVIMGEGEIAKGIIAELVD